MRPAPIRRCSPPIAGSKRPSTMRTGHAASSPSRARKVAAGAAAMLACVIEGWFDMAGPRCPASLLVAFGDLLRDVGGDALVSLIQRRLAGDRLAEPADHGVEDDPAVDIALCAIGDV